MALVLRSKTSRICPTGGRCPLLLLESAPSYRPRPASRLDPPHPTCFISGNTARCTTGTTPTGCTTYRPTAPSNGSDERMRSRTSSKRGPAGHRRIHCGTSLDGDSRLMSEKNSAGQSSPQHAAYRELWGNDTDAPPPSTGNLSRWPGRQPDRSIRIFSIGPPGVPEVEGGTRTGRWQPNQRVWTWTGPAVRRSPRGLLPNLPRRSLPLVGPFGKTTSLRKAEQARFWRRPRPSPRSGQQNARSWPPRRLRLRPRARRRQPKVIEARTMLLLVEWPGQPACLRTFSAERTLTCWRINSVRSCVSPLSA